MAEEEAGVVEKYESDIYFAFILHVFNLVPIAYISTFPRAGAKRKYAAIESKSAASAWRICLTRPSRHRLPST